MRLRTSLGGAIAVAAVVLALTGCGSRAERPTYTPTVVVVRPSPSSTPSASGSPATAPSPSASATAPAPSATSTPSSDAGRPAGQCADDDLGVAIRRAPDGGAAGSEYFDLLLTNTGGGTCELRGAPGVSVVGGGDGTRIGPPADRDQDGATTVRLEPGGSALASLRVTDIASAGGPLGSACEVRKGDGYRVYPPHSTRAFFTEDRDAVACAGSTVFMSVGVVHPR